MWHSQVNIQMRFDRAKMGFDRATLHDYPIGSLQSSLDLYSFTK
jgi:hypothetical protein